MKSLIMKEEMKEKLVSICIPTYNAGDFIEEALKSIVGQSYKNIEIIIGDNTSTDNTYEIVEKFQKKDSRIRYYRNEINLGYSGNCNKLISMSNGDYIAIYHSDDVYDVNIIEKEVEVLNNDIDLLGVFCLYDQIDKHGKVIKIDKFPTNIEQPLYKVNLDEFINIVIDKGGSCFCCPTSMIRKDIYEKLKGYDPNLKYIEDQDMWGRILLNGPIGIINEKLIKYRIHSKQESSIYSDIKREELGFHLQHIKNFVDKNSLEKKYKKKILKTEAIDYMFLAKLAVKRHDYNSFNQKLQQSKRLFNLGYRTKIGLIQNLSSPRLVYFICYIWKSLSRQEK